MLLEQRIPSPNKNFHDDDDNDTDSLTDVSVLIQTKSSDQTSKYSDNSIHDQLFQSLIAYANSFNLDETIYSIQDFKNQFDSIKQQNTKLISSNFSEDYNSDENTTVTDGSKFDWENFQSKELIKKSSPIIICEKSKKRFLRPNIDIQIIRSPTPIIVREILYKPSPSKPPIIPRRKIKHYTNKQSKTVIINQSYQSSLYSKNIFQNLFTS
jgi:hypothetical protein